VNGTPDELRIDATGDPAVRRAGADGLSNLVASLIGGMATLLMLLVVTRERGAAGAGAFFVASAVFAICSNVTELGADTGLLRSIPHDLVTGQRDRIIATLRIALVPPVAVASAVAAALLVAAGPVSGLLGSASTETTAILRGLACFLPFSVLSTLLLAATRGFGRMGPTIVIDRLTRTLLQCATVTLVVNQGGMSLGLAYGAPLLLAAGLSAVALRRLVAGTRKQPDGAGRLSSTAPDRALTREFWTFAGPRALTAGAQILIEKVDVLLVAGLGSITAAGLYSATTRLLAVGAIGATAVMQASQPVLTGLLARHRLDEVRRIAQAATTWTVLVTWPVYGACALLAADVLPLFGSGFGSARVALVVLAVGMLLASGVGPSEVTLLMAGGSRPALVNTLVGLALNVGLNVALIPHYGITGAAVAWTLSLAVTNAAAVIQVRSRLGFLPFAPSWAAAALQVALALGVGYGLATRATGHAARIGVLATAGAVVYLAAGWVLRRRLELPVRGRRAGRGEVGVVHSSSVR
jgi:O-antigen/teichoic acid export membrane protein